MVFALALRNLVHDKVRLAVTLTGVIFAVVLITIQIGLFIGFTKTISCIIDNSGADVWIASKGLKTFDIALPISERKLYQAMSVPGVKKASKFIVRFADWIKPMGGQESIELIGYDLDSGLGGPWNIIVGNVDALRVADTILVDDLYKARLGIKRLGEDVEINDRRARVTGFTKGIRSFTTSPYVFTSFKTAQTYARLKEDQLVYVLVKAEEGVTPDELKRRLFQALSDVDIYTTEEFSAKTQDYWMLSTGAGVALLFAAALGLVVGVVVVAQTLYATTMDHLPEFGTLKAMGANNAYIYKILVLQAMISAVIGYCSGIVISLAVSAASREGDALILVPWQLAVSMFFLTLAMCTCASFISINKVTKIDPLMVFKGR